MATPAPEVRRTVVVTHLLPIELTRSTDGSWSAHWDEEIATQGVAISRYAAIGVRRLSGPVLFVGSPSVYVPPDERPACEAAIAAAGIDCALVHLSPKVASRFYSGFCKATLWPTLHNVLDVYNNSTMGAIIDRDEPLVDKEPSFHEASQPWQETQNWNPIESAEETWADYCHVNRAFANCVVENYADGDVIWVQHYHLLLTPSYLARKLRDATIGLFMHQPFPSSEIFRCLTYREELLRGMLCADHIGFHLFEWARNFLASCRRLLSCTHEVRRGGGLTVTYQGREIAITCSHMGVEPAMIRCDPSHAPSDPTTPKTADLERAITRLRAEHAGCKIFASIDLLEGLKGVPLKLLAFEHLLHAMPAEKAHTLRLLLVGLRPDARPDDHKRCRAEVLSLVARINRAYPKAVVFSEAAGLDLRSRCAIFAVTDVFVATAVREGLNLLPIEYMLAREHAPGALVLSEFCSLARILVGAITCNPWSVRKASAALSRALELPREARVARAAQDFKWCLTNTSSVWAQRVLRDVVAAGASSTVGRSADESGGGLGLGLTWRPPAKLGMGIAEGRRFARLREDELLAAYRTATRRLLLLDHRGTLVGSPFAQQESESSPRSSVASSPLNAGKLAALSAGTASSAMHTGLVSPATSDADLSSYCTATEHGETHLQLRERPKAAPPSQSVRNSLEVLCADHRNTVLVMSTGSREELVAAYGSVPGCSLCADNGLHVAWSGLHGKWEMAGGVSWELSAAAVRAAARETVESWRDVALAVIEVYAERIDGAYVEATPNSLSFVFGNADPEFGGMMAKELHTNLADALQESSVELQLRPGRLSIHPKDVDKGGLLKQALQATQPDFVLVLGDDHTDESAFAALTEWARTQHAASASHDGRVVAYGCVVGKKPSLATSFVDEQAAVPALLETLKWGSLRNVKSLSVEAGLVELGVSDSSRNGSCCNGSSPASNGSGTPRQRQRRGSVDGSMRPRLHSAGELGNGVGSAARAAAGAYATESRPSCRVPAGAVASQGGHRPPAHADYSAGKVASGVPSAGRMANGSPVWEPSMPPVPQSPEIPARAEHAPREQHLLPAPSQPSAQRAQRGHGGQRGRSGLAGGGAPNGSLPHEPSGGCPYRQEEVISGHGGGGDVTLRGPSASGESLLLLGAAVAALITLLGQRSSPTHRRRVLLGLLAAVLVLLPERRRALLRALASR